MSPFPKLIAEAQEELELQEINPSVNHAWMEYIAAEEAYEKYYDQVIITDPNTEYTFEKQLKLQELALTKNEKISDYRLILKLVKDY